MQPHALRCPSAKAARGFQHPRAIGQGMGTLRSGDGPSVPGCHQKLTALFLSLQIMFYVLVKAIYTLGHSVSLISLATGSIILCLFR